MKKFSKKRKKNFLLSSEKGVFWSIFAILGFCIQNWLSFTRREHERPNRTSQRAGEENSLLFLHIESGNKTTILQLYFEKKGSQRVMEGRRSRLLSSGTSIVLHKITFLPYHLRGGNRFTWWLMIQ